jgi:3-oxoacyl-[acyl-carrier protein] reductase
MSDTLTGKVALVTGGARGIGQVICRELASRGARIFVNDVRAEAAEEAAQTLKSGGAEAQAAVFDVSASQEVEAAIDGIRERSGRLDILVNNAGITGDALFVRMKDEDWERVLRINLTGSFFCARAAAKIMMKARYGRIISISSVVGQMGNAGQASYSTSKAGLIGLTKTLARELASRNITVNAVAPGFIETDMTAGLDEKVKAEHLRAIPLGRYGSAEDVAKLVGFLVSDVAGYITGQVIGVNGGMYM